MPIDNLKACPALNPIEVFFLAVKTIFRSVKLEKTIKGEVFEISDLVEKSFYAIAREAIRKICSEGFDRWFQPNFKQAVDDYQKRRKLRPIKPCTKLKDVIKKVQQSDAANQH